MTFGKDIPEKMRNRIRDSHTLPKGKGELPDYPDIGKQLPDSLKSGIPDSHKMPDPKNDSF